MASVYTNEANLLVLVGATRLRNLQDRDEDGVADTGVLDGVIEYAGRTIDRKLKQRYGSSVPFAQITDTPETPEEIQNIASDLALYKLYAHFEGVDGPNAAAYRTDGMDALKALRKGEDDVDGVSRARNYEGAHICKHTAEDATFAGQDANGVSRIRGI